MASLVNESGSALLSKETVLFELYNHYFDGTAAGVIDTGIKLWDGSHPNFRLELEYETNAVNNITVFTCKPDVSPYSGIRIRFQNNSLFTSGCMIFCLSDPCNYTYDSGIIFETTTYGNYFGVPAQSINTCIITRRGNNVVLENNGYMANITITTPRTNNLNLLIGCDYKGSNNSTQRYYKGTITKFKLVEL